jgi:HK97 family phage portal protein
MLSDTTPTFARSTFYPQVGLDLSARFASYGAIYRAQLMVFALVNKLALNTARLPLKVYRRSDTGRTPARDEPYAKLLRNPNPKHDAFFFWLWTVCTFNVHGEAMWVKIRGANGQPRELWPLHPANVFTRRAGPDEAPYEEGELLYVFHLGAGTVPLETYREADVVHFKAYNPDSTIRGMSPLEALRMTLLNEDAARRATEAFWRNGARPSVVLTAPGSLTEGAQQRVKASWDSIHGGVDNFAKTAILEEGMAPHVLSLTAEEAQYIQTRKLSQEECCIAYDVPPPAMHILDHATFSNITEQMRSVYRDTMAPRLGLFESVMDSSLRPDFDATGDLYAEFLMDEVMRGNFEARMEAYAKGIGFGIMKPSEARDKENLSDAGKDADRLFINSTIIPIDATSSRTSAAVPASDVPLKSLSTAQVRSVLGRLGRYDSLAGIEPDRLVAGLNGETETVLAAYAAADTIEDLRGRIKALEGVS